jgi:hypothetical protein
VASVAVDGGQRPGAGCAQEVPGDADGIEIWPGTGGFRQPTGHDSGQRFRVFCVRHGSRAFENTKQLIELTYKSSQFFTATLLPA